MGKTKRQNRHRSKPVPTRIIPKNDMAVDSNDEGDDDDNHVSSSNQVRGLLGAPSPVQNQTNNIVSTLSSLLQQLKSVSVEAKECACCTLSSLLDKPESVEHILRLNCVKIIGPLLTDSNSATRHSAVGVLRKLSAVDHEACEEMVNQDVMTSLLCLFKKQYSPGWKLPKVTDGKISSFKETFIEATYLLLNLCESSSRAVKTFNKENVLRLLLPCLQVEAYDYQIAIAVAYCLQTVTEDNAHSIGVLNEKENEELVNSLFAIESSKAHHILYRVLLAGIILNRNFGRLNSATAIEVIMQLLADTLSVKTLPLLTAVADQKGEKAVESLDQLLSAQQLAVEMLINICCIDDDGGEEEWDGSDDSDEMSLVEEMDCDQNTQTAQSMLNVPNEVVEAVIKRNFSSLILSKLQLPDEEVVKKLKETSEGKKLIQQLHKIQSRSLLCLNNLSSCLETEQLGGEDNLFAAWTHIGNLIFQTQNVELLEAASKAMGGIVLKLSPAKCQQLTLDDLNKLFELERSAEDAQVKANLIRIVANLGCVMGQSLQHCTPQIKAVGVFLLEACHRENAVWVSCEAVDAILDVFGDDQMDPIMHELGMLDKLKSFLPQLKHKISCQRRELDQHLAVVMTAKTNLNRFIEYKASR